MKTILAGLPFVVFLFILPFPEIVSLRLACLAAAFVLVVISWRELALPSFPCRGAIALWAGVVIASLSSAVDPAYSLGEIKNEVGYALMAFVTFLAWTRDETRLRVAGLAVLAGFAVISASALLGADLRHGEWPADAYYGGVGGVSHYLVTVGPVLALTVAVVGRRHAGKWLAVLGVPFIAVALLSAQRAVWPAFGVQVVVVGVWLWRVRAVAIGPVRAALAGALVLALVVAGVYVSDRYRTGGDPESPVAIGKDLRPQVWRKVGEEILAHPLAGAGFGRAVMGKAYPGLPPAEREVFWHPHNLVFNYGIGAGVPGMAAVLALFAALAGRFGQLAVRGERLARLCGLTGATMVAGVLARNMANDFFVREGALLFWALAGVLFGYALRQESMSGKGRARVRQARPVVGVTDTSVGGRSGKRAA